LANLKGSVDLILAKASPMRVTIPLDWSTRPLIPLPRFFRSQRIPSTWSFPCLISSTLCLSVKCCAFIL
jgi:hypothetical protein